jgi:hypothetical protein
MYTTIASRIAISIAAWVCGPKQEFSFPFSFFPLSPILLRLPSTGAMLHMSALQIVPARIVREHFHERDIFVARKAFFLTIAGLTSLTTYCRIRKNVVDFCRYNDHSMQQGIVCNQSDIRAIDPSGIFYLFWRSFLYAVVCRPPSVLAAEAVFVLTLFFFLLSLSFSLHAAAVNVYLQSLVCRDQKGCLPACLPACLPSCLAVSSPLSLKSDFFLQLELIVVGLDVTRI